MPASPEPHLPAAQPPAPNGAGVTCEIQQQLDLLSIFHFVYAGFLLFQLLIPACMFVGAQLMLSDSHARTIGELFSTFSGYLCVVMLALVILAVEAGVELRRHRRYRFCFTVAVIQCLNAPFGTVLGVFTIIVLHKPATKRLFGVA